MTPFAFVFPGQGSQSVGMLDAWADHPAVTGALQEASDALGEDLARLIREGPKEALGLTTNTQPVMLVAGVAAWRAWQAEGGPQPAMLAGHSLGEYSALVAAGAMTLTQAAPLVRLRAEAMQKAVPVGAGAMAAILGLEPTRVIAGCAEATATFGAGSVEVAEAVNFNDPVQTVIAGSKAAVEKACEILKAAGAKRTLMLPVSAPFHSSLMRPAARALHDALASIELAPLRIPVLNNVDVKVESSAVAIRDALVRQAAAPVRWVECIQALRAKNIKTVVECGPGKVLTGMTKRIAPEIDAAFVADPTSLADVRNQLAAAVGA